MQAFNKPVSGPGPRLLFFLLESKVTQGYGGLSYSIDLLLSQCAMGIDDLYDSFDELTARGYISGSVDEDYRCLDYSIAGHPDNRYSAEGLRQVDITPNRKRKPMSVSKRMRILEKFLFRCVYCGECKNLCIDHIVPKCHGGSDEDANLQACCRKCNASKGILSHSEYLKKREEKKAYEEFQAKWIAERAKQ